MATTAIEQSHPQIKDNDGPKIVAVTLVCTLTAVPVVFVRLYSRIKVVRSFGKDDLIMSVAMLLSLIGAALILVEVHYGGGRHVEDVPAKEYTMGLMINTLTMLIYAIAIAMVKISVGCALLRIAWHTNWRYLIMATMVVMGSWAVTSVFTITFQCSPLAKRWDDTIPGICWPSRVTRDLGYFDVSLNITTDLIFAVIIPVPLFCRINANARRRIYLIMVLGLGILACVACSIKTLYLCHLASHADFLWTTRWITIWTVVELNTGIAAGSIPATRACFHVLFGDKSGRPDVLNKAEPLSLSIGGSHRRSWRVLSSAHEGELRSDLGIVREDGRLYELVETPVGDGSGASETGRKSWPSAVVSPSGSYTTRVVSIQP